LKQSSWPGELVRWLDRYGGLLKSAITEAQVFEVLRRPYFARSVSPSFIDGVRRIFSQAELMTIDERVVACRDPTDDKFLELAVNGRADVLVTGDLDLLILNPFRGLPIITPRVFVHELTPDT
jgi:predicted nucleic acid-binding protein